MPFAIMTIIPVICLLFILNSVNCQQREPSISYISPEQEKDVGSSASFDCSVMNEGGRSVIWQKSNPLKPSSSTPVTNGGHLMVPELGRKYEIKRTEDKPTSTVTYQLKVKDIKVKDAGVYQCLVMDPPNDSITKEVSLQVRQSPVISENSTKTITAEEGKMVRLECLASGYPPPKITWKRKNSAVKPTGAQTTNEQVFRFQSVSRTDRGVYYCTADNGIGKNVTREMIMEVEFKPVITVPEARIGQSLKYDIDLVCRIEAYPSPTITWYKDGIQLNSNEHYSISQAVKASEYAGHTDAVIRVLSIEKHQYGRYECKAVNQLGVASATVELFESKEPNLAFRGVLNSADRSSSHLSFLYSFLSSALLLKSVSSL